MKPEDILDSLGGVNEEMLAAADQARQNDNTALLRKKRRNLALKIGSAAASVAAVAGIGIGIATMPTGVDALAVAEAQYPNISPYPDPTFAYTNNRLLTEVYEDQHDAWAESRKAIRPETGYADGLDGYFTASIGKFLSETDGENRVFSPVSLYMALAVLAETTDGDSRAQILNLIGTDDIASTRNQANAVWRGSYSNDGATTSILANSLWFDNRMGYNSDTMQTIADSYYAGVYHGKMGSDALNDAMRDWLSEQTGGLLDHAVRSFEITDPDTVMTLFSTVYYRAKWEAEFLEKNNEDGVFHSPSGDVEAEFMYREMEDMYYWSENFAAVKIGLENSGWMWLVLPDEDVPMDTLLADEKMYQLVLSDNGYLKQEDWQDSRDMIIHLRLPKFDISSNYSVADGLAELGVSDIFDPETADFTPLAEDMAEVVETYGSNLFVGDAKQAARIAIDEEGVTAAAYTEMRTYGAAPPPENEVEFTLDRPFFFLLTHDSGVPLFTGVVNEP